MSKIFQRLKSEEGYALAELMAFITIIGIFIMSILQYTYGLHHLQESEKQEQEQIIHFKKHRPKQSIVEIIE